MANLTKEEVEQRFPEAAWFARLMRAEFGDGVRITYAKNSRGETVGIPWHKHNLGHLSAIA